MNTHSRKHKFILTIISACLIILLLLIESMILIKVYLLMSACIIGIILYRREATREQDRIRLEETIAENQLQLNVLRSMAEMYYSMHLINLKDNTFESISSRNDIDIYINSFDNAADTIHTVMFNLVSNAFREVMMDFTDLSTLKKRLKNKKSDSFEFINYENKWFRAGFVTIEADSEGYPERVMFVTRLIDAEKRKEEALIQRSNTDELTGCFNRRAFEEDIDGYSKIGIPNNFALLSMDVNGLKRVNDTLGHAAGDELITGAVKCMEYAFGDYGKLYRTGGDEFMAILAIFPSSLPRLIDTFEEQVNKWSGTLVSELAVSIGYICSDEANEQGLSMTEIESLVDKRMYNDKARFYKERGIDRRRQ